ncbi:hypothetical protein ElyMa_004971400 [Elysia marginata]|uniref:LITAF domain-containing protein n=1 Tax=Elysia marginata TaxID=1093978 RepID=A0AAV4J2P1_9GAST|nr:hypothetical protein ElyMa_004971400 [Elysia marginata]
MNIERQASCANCQAKTLYLSVESNVCSFRLFGTAHQHTSSVLVVVVREVVEVVVVVVVVVIVVVVEVVVVVVVVVAVVVVVVVKVAAAAVVGPALWPSGKTLAQRSGGAWFDSRPSQTKDFKRGISS